MKKLYLALALALVCCGATQLAALNNCATYIAFAYSDTCPTIPITPVPIVV